MMKKIFSLFLVLAMCIPVMAASAITTENTYPNDKMGFELTLPASWEGRYGVVEEKSFYGWPDSWYFVTFYDLKLKEYSEKIAFPDDGAILSIVVLPPSEYPWYDELPPSKCHWSNYPWLDIEEPMPGFRGIILEDKDYMFFCLTRSDAPGFPVEDAKSREITSDYIAMYSDIEEVLDSFVRIDGNASANAQEPSNTPSDWATTDVNQAINDNLVPSSLQSAYSQATTRAEFCALAVSLYETVKGQEIEIDTSVSFTDTTDVDVYKAATIGVVNGVGEGRFAPDTSLTREQAATMLARLADSLGKAFPKTAATFSDTDSISVWAIEAVGQVQSAGIMSGVGNNTFSPAGAYTREQSIVTILRLFNKTK